MPEDLSKELRFKFESQGSSDTLHVVQMEGSEGLSELFRFELTLVCNNANLDFDQIMAAPATLKIKSHDGKTEVPYHGVLTSFEQLGRTNEYYFYRAVLQPRLARLMLDCVNEIYTADKSVPQIIEDVLKKSGLSGQDYELYLKDPSIYRNRSFICQYRESSFNFISRWMEKLGMYYFFDHSVSSEKIKITDFKNAHTEEGKVSLDYCQPEDLQTANQDHAVYDLTHKRIITPAKVVVQDYNYRTATMLDSLKAEVPITLANAGGCQMRYGDNIRDVGEAKYLATVKQEEITAHATTFSGESTAVGIRSGYFIAINRHYRDDVNADYLVTKVQHKGSQAGALLSGANTPYAKDEGGTVYQCRFEAIAQDIQFRAPQISPRPVVAGVLSAVIDDESTGKYAQLDAFGQYKIDPLYDMTENKVNKKSAWVRMGTPYAGEDHGMHFPLLKGTEVVLAFMGGDPDQPVIISAVTNSNNRNIVNESNNTDNVIKTASGHRMIFDDRAGRECMIVSSADGENFKIVGNFYQK
jgi:type VI secretion system VgrG family protein